MGKSWESVMSCCSAPRAVDEHFGPQAAGRDLKRYRQKGPDRTTQLMIDGLSETKLDYSNLLDIGGGIGVLHHEMLGGMIDQAVHVEISSAYIEASKEEDRRRGTTEQVAYIRSDTAASSDLLPAADVGTLDPVLCCYPDWEGLLRSSARKAEVLYVISVPRSIWYVRLAIALEYLFRRLRGSRFRTFVHPVARIHASLKQSGFQRVGLQKTWIWQVAFYARSASVDNRMKVKTLTQTRQLLNGSESNGSYSA